MPQFFIHSGHQNALFPCTSETVMSLVIAPSPLLTVEHPERGTYSIIITYFIIQKFSKC